MNDIKTPYYLIDLSKIKEAMDSVQRLKDLSSIKCLLALKAFSTWPVFPWFKDALDGTTSSSIFELKLGKEHFGKEAHAYSVAYSEDEMREVARYGDKVIFNSISQLKAYAHYVKSIPIGLRVNPLTGFSPYKISNPILSDSRLGAMDGAEIISVLPLISGVMIHNHCDNQDFQQFNAVLDEVESRFSWRALLAAPAALLILSQIGAVAALVGTFFCGIMALSARNPYEHASQGERDDMEACGVSDRAGERKAWGLAGLTSILAVIATCFCPPVGIAVFGLFATGLVTAMVGGVTHFATSHKKSNSSSESEHTLPQQAEAIGHPALRELSRLPSVAEPAEKPKGQEKAPSIEQIVIAPHSMPHDDVIGKTLPSFSLV